jgi:hypothetical protein
VIEVLAATTDESGFAFGPGLIGFVVLAGLALAVIVLYLSLRKQLKRIDFDPEGRTDAERMRRQGPTGDGATRRDVLGGSDLGDPAEDGNGHREP